MMKAYRIVLALLAACLLSAGCSHDTFVQGVQMTMSDFTVRESDWSVNQDEGFFMVSLNVPQITTDVVKYGTVSVSRFYANDEFWTPLPAQRTEWFDVDGGDPITATTFTDFEWGRGTVNVFVTASDLYTGVVPPAMNLRVIITR